MPVGDVLAGMLASPLGHDVGEGTSGIFIPRMNDGPAASIAFWFASEIIPASATTVTSGS
jgi:hypothetical protein